MEFKPKTPSRVQNTALQRKTSVAAVQRRPKNPLQRQLAVFTNRPVVIQRQVVQPVLQAISIQRNEESRLTVQRLALKQQAAQINISPSDVEAALQRQKQPATPVPLRPQTTGDWVAVMRFQAEQATGRLMSSREAEQLTALQRQVAQTLSQGYLRDRQPALRRHQEYAEHVVGLQRHPISGRVADVFMRNVPPAERLFLQRAVDDQLQREALQRQQDEQVLQRQGIQRQLAELDDQATRPILQRIQAKRGSGNPLPKSVQRHLEQGLNHDLSRVRIHDNAEANKLAKGVNAIAFTTGNDIFFQSGQFNPNTQSGLELLAHEVTHTVQQSQGRVGKGVDPDSGLEAEARTMGKQLAQRFSQQQQMIHKGTLVGQQPKSSHQQQSHIIQRKSATNSGSQMANQQSGEDLILKSINALLNLKLTKTADLYPYLKSDANRRMNFFGGIYGLVSKDSQLYKLINSSTIGIIKGYLAAIREQAAGKSWDQFSPATRNLFKTAGSEERVFVINAYGGNARMMKTDIGGNIGVEKNGGKIQVEVDIHFVKVGNFPADMSFERAKSIFINQTQNMWSNKFNAIIESGKTSSNLKIEVKVNSKSDSPNVGNIYGAAFGRSNVQGTVLSLYLFDQYGNRDPQFGLMAAHEAGHFIFGARDEYVDVTDKKGHVIGAKSTTNDSSIMSNFRTLVTKAEPRQRHLNSLKTTLKEMFKSKADIK